jgi:hypothetical protein
MKGKMKDACVRTVYVQMYLSLFVTSRTTLRTVKFYLIRGTRRCPIDKNRTDLSLKYIFEFAVEFIRLAYCSEKSTVA